jgi:integrase
MRGSIRGQTLHLFNESGINQIGHSKFSAKSSARIALAAEGRGGTSTAIAEKTGIHSFGTRDTYLDKWQELGRFCKQEFKIRDLEKVTTDHVREFLAYKTELGVSYSHWSGYSAAVSKLENALNAYSDKNNRGNTYNFRTAVKELRPDAKAELPRFAGTRNYDNPHTLLDAISNLTHQLVGRIQHESGLRIAGATNINTGQLMGLAKDAITGKVVGLIDYKGKGGKLGRAQVNPETYRKLTDHIKKQGELKVSGDSYRTSLKTAAQATGQEYNGSHGLRWNFAQERFAELQKSGVSYEKALGEVSRELGHNRINITEHYLGFK